MPDRARGGCGVNPPGWVQRWAREHSASPPRLDPEELAVRLALESGQPVHLTYGEGVQTFGPDDDALLAAILRRMIASQAEYAYLPVAMKDGYFALDSSAELSEDECAALLRAGVVEAD